ncbi:MAG: hypothetical protein MUF73_00555 [Rhodobacteraceae bacterium]|jgi:ABC-type cobalamin/Fe3+-siderophores transport system ATPase subunit|nr:hypothetical protein [Paracoccaceae bacterium]
MIEMRDIHTSPRPLKVRKGVNLTVRTGKAMSVVGGPGSWPGSGKSPLLTCLNGPEPIHSDAIVVDGAAEIAVRHRMHVALADRLTVDPGRLSGRPQPRMDSEGTRMACIAQKVSIDRHVTDIVFVFSVDILAGNTSPTRSLPRRSPRGHARPKGARGMTHRHRPVSGSGAR